MKLTKEEICEKRLEKLEQERNLFRELVKKTKKFDQYASEIPDVIFEKASWIYVMDMRTIGISIPFDRNLMPQLKEEFEKQGYKGWPAEYPQTQVFWIWLEKDGFKLSFTISTPLEKKDGQSTCVMIPIEWTKESSVKVTRYQRVCPEDYPQEFDEEGKYIGDGLPL